MIFELSAEMLMGIGGGIVTLGTAFLTIKKVLASSKRDKELEKAEILREVKEMDSLLKSKLESRLEAIKAELKNLELNVNKDFSYIRESHEGEIKALGEKIENLRSDLSNQHGSLLALLTKLINNKD